MSFGIASSATELDDQSYQVVDECAERFEIAWRQSGAQSLAEFLPADSTQAMRRSVLIELIKLDLEFRSRHGEPRLLEEYQTEWHQDLHDDAILSELLELECLTRFAQGVPPDRHELLRRFPGLADRIDLNSIAAEARGDAQQDSKDAADVAKSGSNTASASGDETRLSTDDDFNPSSFGGFEIRGILGSGGMGVVYRAYDPRLQRTIALKLPKRRDSFTDRNLMERFLQEGRAAARFPDHPNICKIFDAGEVDGCPYLAMKLVDGKDLNDWVETARPSAITAAQIVRKIADALQTLHESDVVHRDIKAGNVMIDSSGEPVLVDFGLAQTIMEAQGISRGTHCSGTPAYMAPELVSGEASSVDARAEVYSLGVLFFHLLRNDAGGDRLDDDTAREPTRDLEHVDPGLAAICTKAMQTSPGARYQSAGDFAIAIDQFLDQTNPGRRHATRLRPAMAVAAVLGLMLITFLATSWLRKAPKGEPSRSGDPAQTAAPVSKKHSSASRAPVLAAIATELKSGTLSKNPFDGTTHERRIALVRLMLRNLGSPVCIEAARFLNSMPWPEDLTHLGNYIFWDRQYAGERFAWQFSRKRVIEIPFGGCLIVRGRVTEKSASDWVSFKLPMTGRTSVMIVSTTERFRPLLFESWWHLDGSRQSNTQGSSIGGITLHTLPTRFLGKERRIDFRITAGEGSAEVGEYVMLIWQLYDEYRAKTQQDTDEEINERVARDLDRLTHLHELTTRLQSKGSVASSTHQMSRSRAILLDVMRRCRNTQHAATAASLLAQLPWPEQGSVAGDDSGTILIRSGRQSPDDSGTPTVFDLIRHDYVFEASLGQGVNFRELQFKPPENGSIAVQLIPLTRQGFQPFLVWSSSTDGDSERADTPPWAFNLISRKQIGDSRTIRVRVSFNNRNYTEPSLADPAVKQGRYLLHIWQQPAAPLNQRKQAP